MKTRSMTAGIAALALAAAAVAAQAQGAGQGQRPGGAPQQPAIVTPTVNLTLEQRHIIKEIIKDVKVDQAPAGTATSVGAPVPGNVHLSPMPAEVAEKVPQIKSHLFFVAGGKIVIVDPKDHTVADAIE
jgi:Protein of unknown function (DUF1236)